MYRPGKVKRFDFPTGRSVAGKYIIERPLGSGWDPAKLPRGIGVVR